MRHVNDGELHAYLDGALDHLPEGRGEEVRDHLASCPVCQERLQDETRVRKQARDLLAAAAPDEKEAPPFESLRSRAEVLERSEETESGGEASEAPSASPFGGMPLAWAATVVLALGVGWMGGKMWSGMPQSPRTQFNTDPTNALPATMSREGDAEVLEEAAEAPEEPAGAASEEAAQGAPMRLEAPGGTADRRDTPVAGAPSLAPGADAPVSAQRSGADEPGAPDLGISPAALPEPSEALAPPTSELEQARRRSFMDRAASLPSAAPELMEPDGTPPDYSLAVPGLELLSVEWEEWIPGERSLRIRQRLPTGDTLELRYLNMLMGSDPGQRAKMSEEEESRMEDLVAHPPPPAVLKASLPPGWNQVVMKKGRMWLVARAPVSEDQIRALLRSLR